MASYPMKVGVFLCGMVILHGVGGSGSRIFSKSPILSCFMMCGGSPDCRMMVKNAFSRGEGHFSVILFICSIVVSLVFMLF